jgi:hypothetical protein
LILDKLVLLPDIGGLILMGDLTHMGDSFLVTD